MAGLAETIGRLRKAGRVKPDKSGESGDARMVEVRGFGFNPGALRMLAYVPQGCPTGAPLVVVLHGCTQRAGAHAAAAGWLTLADRLGFVVVAPEQESQNNPNRCFNWFETGDITRGAGEAASIHAMVQHMMRTHDVDPARVFVTGLSAGGAMAAVMLATYPELFAAGAVIAGLPYGVAQGMHEAFGAMHGGGSRSDRELVDLVTSAAPWPGRAPRLSVWHGGADQTVKPSNGVALARQWAGVHGLGQPDEVEERAGRVRSVWRGRDGEVLVEMNVVAGLGHGVPLATTGDDPLGVVAPFMLEANVSSSLEISRFWGIASPATPDRGWNTAPAEDPHQAGGRRAPVGEQVMASVAPHVPQDIQQVIAKALGAAGLMR